MLWTQMMDFFKSWFIMPEIGWGLVFVSLGIAIGFGAIWLLGYWPPFFKKLGFWGVMVVSAFLTLLAITFIQIPLQYYINQGIENGLGVVTMGDWYLLAGIPVVLISGLVQEAVKAVPVAFWWRYSGKAFTPKMGLLVGAAAGAGFGIFEAFWVHTSVFNAGWTTQVILIYGFDGIIPFWERFFGVGFHIAASALVGYGIAKGKWWQYLLVAAGLHTLVNYSAVFFTYFTYINPADWLKNIHIELYIALIAVIATAWALILRWRKDREEPFPPSDIPAELAPPAETLPPPIDMATPPGA